MLTPVDICTATTESEGTAAPAPVTPDTPDMVESTTEPARPAFGITDVTQLFLSVRDALWGCRPSVTNPPYPFGISSNVPVQEAQHEMLRLLRVEFFETLNRLRYAAQLMAPAHRGFGSDKLLSPQLQRVTESIMELANYADENCRALVGGEESLACAMPYDIHQRTLFLPAATVYFTSSFTSSFGGEHYKILQDDPWQPLPLLDVMLDYAPEVEDPRSYLHVLRGTPAAGCRPFWPDDLTHHNIPEAILRTGRPEMPVLELNGVQKLTLLPCGQVQIVLNYVSRGYVNVRG